MTQKQEQLKPCPCAMDDSVKTPWWMEPFGTSHENVRIIYTAVYGPQAKIPTELLKIDLIPIGHDTENIRKNAVGKLRNIAARRGYVRIYIHKIWMPK